ncbi:response regulator [Candidatus Omnitrophota bacterium]
MKKILVVDDDNDIREITAKNLRQAGYEAMIAASGREALDICQKHHPDLVLLDIAIPQMDGYETCRKIKQDTQTRDIAVLLVTGKGLLPEGINKHCQDLGACGYISKPCTTGELLDKIREVLAE